ncbi:MAG: hypothetical protein KGZ50_03690 [Peptococcaceae bacterium]|nr:hypothetical protein [Peptococcaceae bacterium]
MSRRYPGRKDWGRCVVHVSPKNTMGKVLVTLSGGVVHSRYGGRRAMSRRYPGRKDRGRCEGEFRSNALLVRCPCVTQKHHGEGVGDLVWRCNTPAATGGRRAMSRRYPGRKDRGRCEGEFRSNALLVRCPCVTQKHHGEGVYNLTWRVK